MAASTRSLQIAYALLLALQRAYAELPALTSLHVEQGAVCGPDGCEPAAESGGDR